MSLVKRFIRLFQTNRASELEARDLAGIAGEQYAAKFLDRTVVAAYVANPMLPHPNNGQKYLETDLLVYAAGTLFCVEVKNYRGVISHVLGDPTQIVQQKNGRYGEAIPEKFHQNPLRQAKGFVFHLKTYLAAQVDPRFKNLFIVAVAAFVRNADTNISRIWNFGEGIIYVDDLPQFFQAKGNPRFAARPSRWIVEGLDRVPRPDVIETVAGDQLRGFVMHPDLALDVGEERPLLVPFQEIREVRLSRGRFSDSDRVEITLNRGETIVHQAAAGKIRMRTLDGYVVSKRLLNLVTIRPGRPVAFPAALRAGRS
jgi:hypothetical protein